LASECVVVTVRPSRARASTSALTGRGEHGWPRRSTGQVGPALIMPYAPGPGGGARGLVGGGEVGGGVGGGAVVDPVPVVDAGPTAAVTAVPVGGGVEVGNGCAATVDVVTPGAVMVRLAEPAHADSTIAAASETIRLVIMLLTPAVAQRFRSIVAIGHGLPRGSGLRIWCGPARTTLVGIMRSARTLRIWAASRTT
jgi:hypothetical protein